MKSELDGSHVEVSTVLNKSPLINVAEVINT